MEDVIIKPHSVPLSDESCMTAYEVLYIAKHGDGCTCGDVWRSFGMFERREVADYVAQCIDDGTIKP